MSDIQQTMVERPALGVGTIFTETFAIFFRRFGWFALLALVPALAMEMLDLALTELIDFGMSDPDGFMTQMLTYAGLTMLASAIGGSIATAMIAQAAYDAKLGNRSRPGFYVGQAFRNIVPLAILAILLGIVSALGMAALIVPGIWLMGLWSAVVPALVIERCGFEAISRSHALTRDYRWQAAGALLLVWLIILLISGAIMVPLMAGLGLAALEGATAGGYQIASVIASTVIGTIQLSLSSICTALIYARLREIKEGAPMETLAEVFE